MGAAINYYERHIGDYYRDAWQLSMLEHGAYTLLMDRYYLDESGIQDAQRYDLTGARSEVEQAAIDKVLARFFRLIDGVWIKNRVEEEIAHAKRRIEAARANGGKGGRPRKQPNPIPTQTQEKPSGLLVGSDPLTQSKAHHTPDTNHQSKALQQTTSSDPPQSDAATPAVDVALTSRAMELTLLLRARGASVLASNPYVIGWAQRGVTDAEALSALEVADRQRHEKRSTQPVNAAYLDSILVNTAREKTAPDSPRVQRARSVMSGLIKGNSHDH